MMYSPPCAVLVRLITICVRADHSRNTVQLYPLSYEYLTPYFTAQETTHVYFGQIPWTPLHLNRRHFVPGGAWESHYVHP